MTEQQELAEPKGYWYQLRQITKNLRKVDGFWKEMGTDEAFMGWLHCEGKCVYCGINLINQRNMTEGLIATDHLLPKKKYPELDFTNTKLPLRNPLNAVTACAGCNGLKRSWDPNEGTELYVIQRHPLRLETQLELIGRAKGRIDDERARRCRTNPQDLKSLEEAMEQRRPLGYRLNT